MCSPVAAVVHGIGNHGNTVGNHGNAGSSIPTSTLFKQPRRVKSPAPLKAYKINQGRRSKSTESLAIKDREEPAPSGSPVQAKKTTSPLSAKFARARKLFGIRRSGENSSQSRSMTDVSKKSSSPVNSEHTNGEDMSNPMGVSLSEGDADALNTTYTIDGASRTASNGLFGGKRNGLIRKGGLLSIGNHRSRQMNGHHVSNGHHATAVEERHRESTCIITLMHCN